jgi:predicted negative regulator of RcsB-dependent stress response
MNIWRMFDSIIYGKYSIQNLFYRYARLVFSIFMIFLLLFSLYFGRKKWIMWREQSAQLSIAHLMERLQNYQNGTLEKSDIVELHEKIAAEQTKHKDSSLFPYFGALQAQVFVQEGRLDEAAESLEESISFNENAITYHQLRTTQALILLDTKPEKGIELLEELIADKKNLIKDVAQFYLGRYYWVHNDIERASVIWNELLQDQAEHRMSPSPFKAEVQTALSALISKS